MAQNAMASKLRVREAGFDFKLSEQIHLKKNIKAMLLCSVPD